MPKFIDLTGQIFGRLTPIKYVGKSRWSCVCECGKNTHVSTHDLRSGHSRSCGCLAKENLIKRSTKHGCAGPGAGKNKHIYMIYHNMLSRCLNKNNKKYKDYGGRNPPITVCERWSNKENGFINFYKDIGEIPEGLTLDRINNNGNYEPNNWRLATPQEQSRNKRNTIYVVFNNKNRLLIELSEEYNIPYQTLYRRICIDKWLIKKALTTPVKNSKKKTLQESYDEMYKNIQCPIFLIKENK